MEKWALRRIDTILWILYGIVGFGMGRGALREIQQDQALTLEWFIVIGIYILGGFVMRWLLKSERKKSDHEQL